jgi:hypothetical protein
LKQSGSGHDLARLAVTTLGYVALDPSLLHRMVGILRQTLNRHYIESCRFSETGFTGSNGMAVKVHGTGTTLADPATKLGAGQI